MYLVDGLRGGGWAVVGQAHHALVDGIAAVEVAMLLFDAAGHRRRPARPARWAPAPPRVGAGRAAAFARDRVGGAARARGRRPPPSATAATCRGAVRSAGGAGPGRPRSTARPRTAARSASAITSLEGAREAGRRHGATINDVLLAAATLALGRALRRRGERPAAVKALVPVNVRGGGEAGRHGQPHLVRHRLAAGRRDRPDRRPARACARDTRARKAAAAPRRWRRCREAAELLPGGARRVVARTAARAASFNAVVSNVPGPPVELDAARAAA